MAAGPKLGNTAILRLEVRGKSTSDAHPSAVLLQRPNVNEVTEGPGATPHCRLRSHIHLKC